MNSRERLLDILDCREVSEDGTLEIGAIVDINPEDFAALRELDSLLDDIVTNLYEEHQPSHDTGCWFCDVLIRAAQAGYGEK